MYLPWRHDWDPIKLTLKPENCTTVWLLAPMTDPLEPLRGARVAKKPIYSDMCSDNNFPVSH